MKKILTIIFFVASLYADSITVSEVSKFIGEEKTVCGEVSSTYYDRTAYLGPTYLNFEKLSADESFKVVIYQDVRENFKVAPEYFYNKKNICVTGMIEKYDDSFQIIVSSDFQIK